MRLKNLRICWALFAAAALSGCAGGGIGPDSEVFSAPVGLSAEAVGRLNLRRLIVTVPSDLSISTNPDEQFPQTDIVWYEDPAGDRRAQVQAIVQTAMSRGLAGLDGSVPVDITVTVRKFHAVTPKALASSLPAWHDIQLDIVMRAADGSDLAAIAALNADSEALTQDAARAARANGESQKSRIIARISQAVQAWLQSGV